jgi:protein-L-isoaspartate(D-aspartate) O-methyltransferase
MLALAGGWSWGCGGDSTADQEAYWAKLREEMVTTQIAARGVREAAVLTALRTVPRHLFVPPDVRAEAYADHPLPIGEGQTISQPYIVGLMTELLEAKPGDRVLEIGTGSGYQAAVLDAMGCEVYTIEIRTALAREAEKRLVSLGYTKVHVRAGDGYAGWPEAAPFAGIIVTAAPERIPTPLLDQLEVGGRMVIPVGAFFQDLLVLTKTPAGIEKKNIIPVRFVPMTGEAQQKPR